MALLLDSKLYGQGGDYDPMLQANAFSQLRAAYNLKKVKPAGNLVQALANPLRSSNEQLRSEAMRLAGLWKVPTFRDEIENVAMTRSQPGDLRCAALESLGYYGGGTNAIVLARVASSSELARVRSQAIRSLLSMNPKESATAAAEFLSRPAEDASVDELFGAFLARPTSLPLLAEELRGRKPTADAAKIGLRKMAALGRTQEKLTAVLVEAAGLAREKKQLSDTEIKDLAGEVRLKGDAVNGGKIYARQELNCSACHTIQGKGGSVGPDLSALGTAQPLEFIIGAILYPNREVKEGFVAFEVTTRDGESHQGYILAENGQELTMKDVAIGKEVRLSKKEIASRVQRGSVMPEGLADTLTRAEFRDLVRYLSGLGR
jgi:putative heme-binding domain-containing protein